MYTFTPEARKNRIRTWEDTITHYKDKKVLPSIKTNYVPTQEDFDNFPRSSNVDVFIINKDCINVAREFTEKGLHVMLLNMADWYKAGGLVEGGVATQEEECFRRSDYHLHLLQDFYPLDTYDLTISRGVEYYKASDNEGFTLLPKPFNVDMIASPALAGPHTIDNNSRFRHKTDIAIMKNKIRQLFYWAAANNNDCIVLSAWGCGAFCCPTKHVAELFKEVIEETKGIIPVVAFAIFPAHPSLKGTDRDAFQIFSDVF